MINLSQNLFGTDARYDDGAFGFRYTYQEISLEETLATMLEHSALNSS